eukprot:5876391-Lingulodinium_polyedra.AAC.1
MGNAPSMLLWAIGYDPVVEAAQGATYVDDMAGLTLGVEQTLRLPFILMVASHAAGLRIASHSCVTVYARSVHPAVRQVFR